jgi:RNA polymerase primary sigma factor
MSIVKITYLKNKRQFDPRACEEDVRQVGALWLTKAVDRFDLSRGFKFVTFAMHYVRFQMLRAAARWNTQEANARLSGWTCPATVSIDKPVGEDGVGSIHSMIGESVRDELAEKEEQEKFWKVVRESLPDRLRQVIVLRFKHGKMLHEIGEQIGVSRQRVNQLELEALAMLRAPLREAGLADMEGAA